MLLMHNPTTGDPGINPLVFILIIVCAILIIGCLVWAFFLNRKNSTVKQTVITVTEEDDQLEPTIVEEIDDSYDESEDEDEDVDYN